MLQLTENKPRRQTQIAKKSKNGLPRLCFSSAVPPAAKTAALYTPTAPQIGVLRASMLPCYLRYQPAISGVSCTGARGRGEGQ